VIGQEARYSVPEKLPDALFALVNQLNDRQEQECWALVVCQPCRAAATSHLPQDKALGTIAGDFLSL
jgi:hypothetical protein